MAGIRSLERADSAAARTGPPALALQALSLVWFAAQTMALGWFMVRLGSFPRVPADVLASGRAGDAAALLVVQTIGALVAVIVIVRRPRHAVGWLLMVMSTGFFAYAAVALLAVWWSVADALPPGWWSALDGSGSFFWLSTFVAATWLLLTFPDGRLPSSRWRPVAAAVATVQAAMVVVLATTPMRISPSLDNAFRPEPRDAPLLGALLLAGVLLGLATAFVSLVTRWRVRTGVEALQLKWAVAGFGLTTAWALGTTAAWPLIGEYALASWIGGLAALPRSVAIAVAILRYRLYAIDRIVSRTASYGLLTALLVGVYAGSVVLLQRLLAPVTGESDLAVAASTLVVAGLFRPARRRIQAAVDRSFDRGRYDTERTLGAFRARLRDEVDLDDLRADLLGTVAATVQPSASSLWLREP